MRAASRRHCLALLVVPLLLISGAAVNAQSIIIAETTLVTLTSSANPATADEPFTLTAAVTTPQGGGVPGGSIQFIDETTLAVLGWADVASPRIIVRDLPPGRHAIRADYSGSQDYLPLIVQPGQSAPLQLSVLAKPRVLLSSSQNPISPGEVVTLCVTVTGKTAAAKGFVTLRDGDAVLAAHLALDSSGTARFTTSALAPGWRALTASYEGDAEHAPTLSMPLDQSVGVALLRDAQALPRGM
ncbi:Ig-like domain-containing protein [Rhodopseudomonas palustris]|uniref:Bacterial Ig-like domain-containing protein n=1 Tax=Rhodopseudomonas palustris (strain BisB18) TaxID=316056 RepID=Q218T9_RHOPB